MEPLIAESDLNYGKKKSLFQLYIRLVLGIVSVAALFMSIGLLIWSMTSGGAGLIPAPFEPEPPSAADPGRNDDGEIIGGSFIGSSIINAPVKTNFLIAGTDAGGSLTDVIIVGCFDINLMQFDLISIPRDTYTAMAAEDIEILRKAGRSVPSDGVMKINAVHAYAGRESGILFTKSQVERLLGIKIDFYAEISLQAFRNIVDATGGIYMEIPAGGFYYEDLTPGQDLIISVPGGMQLLNGVMAEGVVRYRSTYPRGDIQRVEMQQEFMKQFFAQALTRENIIRNAPAFVSTVINYVNTDFTIADAPKYLKYLNMLNSDSIVTHILPGTETTIKEISYYITDTEKTNELVYEVFYKDNSPAPPQDAEINPPSTVSDVNIRRLKIQVLNGTDTDNLAQSKADYLRGYGFNVINVGNYYGEKEEKTRILTRHTAEYGELTRLFNEPVTADDPFMNENYDIVIILGSDDES